MVVLANISSFTSHLPAIVRVESPHNNTTTLAHYSFAATASGYLKLSLPAAYARHSRYAALLIRSATQAIKLSIPLTRSAKFPSAAVNPRSTRGILKRHQESRLLLARDGQWRGSYTPTMPPNPPASASGQTNASPNSPLKEHSANPP